MAWERLSHVELSSAGDLIDSGTFTAKDNLKVIVKIINDGSVGSEVAFNSDTSESNYASRRSSDGGSDSTYASTSNPYDYGFYTGRGDQSMNRYFVMNIANISDKEKPVIGQLMVSGGTGASNAPSRTEFVAKWANTSSQITSIQIKNNGSGSYNTGSYITVLGASGDDIVTDEKTTITNVPVGTRYEETDTRKIYRKVTPTQASYTNDFSSSTGWTLGSGHTISGNKLSGTFTSGGDRSYLDLSSVNISDDSWVLRFGLKITATNTSSVNVLSMGLADSTAVGSAVFGAGDDFNAIIYTSDNQKYNMRATNGGSSVFYERSTSTPVTNTQYYVELKKISDTSASLRFYDNSDYTAGSNALELLTNTSDTSGLTNLDYFMIKPYDTSSGSHTIEISDLKIYNGVSEVDTNEWKERGTA